MKLFLRLAWRNIWRHRLRTLSIVLTIGLTMALMFFMDGLYNGMMQDMDINTIKLNGSNIQVHAAEYISTTDTPLLPVPNDQAVIATVESLPQVISTSRRIHTSGLASNNEGAFPVSIIGIEPEKELAVSLVAQRISAGRHLNTRMTWTVSTLGKAWRKRCRSMWGTVSPWRARAPTNRFAPAA